MCVMFHKNRIINKVARLMTSFHLKSLWPRSVKRELVQAMPVNMFVNVHTNRIRNEVARAIKYVRANHFIPSTSSSRRDDKHFD